MRVHAPAALRQRASERMRVRPARPRTGSTGPVGPTGPVDTAVRLLRRALRSPTLRMLAVTVVGLAALSSLRARQAELDTRLAALGERRPVVVVLGDHRTGDLLGPGDVEIRQLPRSFVPDAALARFDGPRRLRDAVRRGETLVEDRLADPAVSALAAAVPVGTRGVAVPLPAAGPTLVEGDRVDLSAIGPAGRTEPLVRDALVVAGTTAATDALAPATSAATIAVPRRMVGPVADAILASTLTVAVVGAG